MKNRGHEKEDYANHMNLTCTIKCENKEGKP